MKTAWDKPVHVISFIRTLLITFSVAVCLATLMGCGYSPEKDASPADDIETMRKAAEAGDARAQYDLGCMYGFGDGVPEDDAEAAKWYRKAAEQGLSVAQYFLGYMYEFGEGVPQDDVAAYAWYSLAAASGDEDGRENRDSIKRKLTPSQIDRGQVMVRETSKRIEKRKAAKGE